MAEPWQETELAEQDHYRDADIISVDEAEAIYDMGLGHWIDPVNVWSRASYAYKRASKLVSPTYFALVPIYPDSVRTSAPSAGYRHEVAWSIMLFHSPGDQVYDTIGKPQ